MKKTTCLLLLLLMFFQFKSYSQDNYEWDVIIDSLDEEKSKLFSKTKMFIGDTWNSAQDVIQYDDKEEGVVLVKGLRTENLYYLFNDHKWSYSYTIKFMVKDNKARIVIEDVFCSDARAGVYEWPKMPISETYPKRKGKKITGVNEERYLHLMNSLKQHLEAIKDAYISAIKKPLISNNSDW